MRRDRLYYENRKNTLRGRGKDNGKIIAKIERKLRKLPE